MTTSVTTTRRKITVREQHRCDEVNCINPATHGCTDSILVNGKRQESAIRRGCGRHPVSPRWQLENGTFISWQEHMLGTSK